jgi:hypothetical protein
MQLAMRRFDVSLARRHAVPTFSIRPAALRLKLFYQRAARRRNQGKSKKVKVKSAEPD